MAKYVLALDQGTTSSRAIVFNHEGLIVTSAQQEFPQIYPSPGLVEHDPEAIWSSQLAVAQEAMKKAGATASDIAAIGISYQTCALANFFVEAFRLQSIANRNSQSALPDNSIENRLACILIPNDCRFALISYANRSNI